MDTVETRSDRRDSEALLVRLDRLQGQMDYLVERQKKHEELFAEMTPILKEVLATATERMAEMEREGLFAFGRELVSVTRKVVQGYGPEDVRQFGDAVVKILDTVRALTQPEVLAIAGQAAGVLQEADAAEPIGILGMVRASRSDDVQKGMAVMMEVLRHVGLGAKALAEQKQTQKQAKGPSAAEERRSRLAQKLAPRASRKVLGVERAPARAEAERAAAPLGPPAGCAVPAPAAEKPVAVVMDGVGFGADGHLSDPRVWTRELAVTLAEAQGVTLDAERWKLVEFARADFEAHGASPNVRRITQGSGFTTKDLYTLFPKAPARTIAKIAGIPKPAGCI